MRSLLINELAVAPNRLFAVLHYDGTPITARFVVQAITRHVEARHNEILRKARST